MSQWTSIVEAVAAGLTTALAILTLGRRAFRHAVQDIVDKSHADLVRRQSDFERRQGQHLDRQDDRLKRIESKLTHRLW